MPARVRCCIFQSGASFSRLSVSIRSRAVTAQIAELKARLAKGSGDNPAYKAAVDALRVALAADGRDRRVLFWGGVGLSS